MSFPLLFCTGVRGESLNTELLDRAFYAVMKGFVEEGRAPHFTKLSVTLGLEMEAGRQALHAIVNAFAPSWLFPGTDLIASFAPFNNLPNQYSVTVRGWQKWFAQCGFEALAITWLFPGETVRIDAPCLDCGEPIILEMRDGEFVHVDPPAVVGHLNHPLERSKEKLPFI